MSEFQLGVEQLRATHESVEALQAVAHENQALQGSVELLEQLELQQFYALCEMVDKSPNMVDFYAGALQRVQITRAALGQLNGQVEHDPVLTTTAERTERERTDLEAFFGLFAPEHPTFVAYVGRTTLAPQVQIEAVVEAPEERRPQIGDTRPAPDAVEVPTEPAAPAYAFDLTAVVRRLEKDLNLSDRDREVIESFVAAAKPGEWFNRAQMDLDHIYFSSPSARNTSVAHLAGLMIEADILERVGERRGTKYKISDYYLRDEETIAPADPATEPEPAVVQPEQPADLAPQQETDIVVAQPSYDSRAIMGALNRELREREQLIITQIAAGAKPGEWFRQRDIDLTPANFVSDTAQKQAFRIMTNELVEAGVLIRTGQRGGTKYQVVDTFIFQPEDAAEESAVGTLTETPAVVTEPAAPAETQPATTDVSPIVPPQGGGGAARAAEEHERHEKREGKKGATAPTRMNKRWGLHSHGIKLDGRITPYEGIEKPLLRALTDVPRREPVTVGFLANKLSARTSEVEGALSTLFSKLPQGWLIEVAGGSNGNPNSWRLGSGIALKERKGTK